MSVSYAFHLVPQLLILQSYQSVDSMLVFVRPNPIVKLHRCIELSWMVFPHSYLSF